MQELTSWAMDPARKYLSAAREEFFRVVDYYLVAQAHAGGHEVVTLERPAPQAKKRILIPDACEAMRVTYREPFSLYRKLGLKFS